MRKAFTFIPMFAPTVGLVVGGRSESVPAPEPEPVSATAGKIFYVNAGNAAGPWDGKSWATAFKKVQEGLDAAAAAGGGEVWVTAGTYKPTDSTDRTIFFLLKPGVALYGGFKGTETSLSQRDWQANVTILSGDIGTPGNKEENSYHVVIGADDAIIDGFTITGGYGFEPGPPPPPPTHISPQIILSGPKTTEGAGILNYQTAPTVRNCIITGNRANKGGGAFNMTNIKPPRRRGTPPGEPESPEAEEAARPVPTFSNCTFSDNSAYVRGGGVSNDLGTDTIFIGCKFINNVCDDKGGGMYNDFGCSPIVTNCVFTGNSATTAGAMGNDGHSNPVITNCTFTKNYVKIEGAALYQGTGPANIPIVTNCILWGNIAPNGVAEIFNWHESEAMVTYSCVQGGYRGTGNIDADPRFVDPEKGDFRLAADSPCINLGNGAKAPEKDIDDNSRYDSKSQAKGVPVDMGAYERQGATTKPATAVTPNPATPPSPAVYSTQAPEKGSVPAADVIYVNVNNTAGTLDGKSWATAFRSLQEGIDYAYAADAEVWVAAGTCKPTDSTDRSISFLLRSGMAVYGGFAGTETSRSQRDWKKDATILSGDIGKPGDNSDNSYHVLVGANDATLDGFTITGGNADGETYYGKGGGMVNYAYNPGQSPFGTPTGLSPTVVNCTFTGNFAVRGGAVYNYDRCTPVFTNCTFTRNYAEFGGANYDNVGANSRLTNCTFSNNRAKWRGGAIVMDYGSRPTLDGCSFTNNQTESIGGAIFTVTRASQLENTAPVITGSTFSGNSAGYRGGAIANYDQTLLELNGCTFSDNHAGEGGGAISNDHLASLTISNCTFTGNSTGQGEADIDTDATSKVNHK